MNFKGFFHILLILREDVRRHKKGPGFQIGANLVLTTGVCDMSQYTQNAIEIIISVLQIMCYIHFHNDIYAYLR